MKKVVIDTNIVISAIISGRNPEKLIFFIASNNHIFWMVSPEILREYQEVMYRRKFKNITEQKKERWCQIFSKYTTCIDVNVTIDFPRDRKNAKFLACAIAANADYLITGDRDFKDVKKSGIMSTQIISVTEFLKLFSDIEK